MRIARAPSPSLRPFIKVLWAVDGRSATAVAAPARELVLPTGCMHLAFRLEGPPLSVYDDPKSATSRELGHAVVGGARSSFYVRDVSGSVCSIGAQFHAGAAPLLLGVAASELAERHVRLEELWGSVTGLWRERLLEAPSLARKLAVFETLLATQLPRLRGIHPAVATALARFRDGVGVEEAARASGHSHRHFIVLFREAVGLAPKRYCRVLRFQDALAASPAGALSSVAVDAGYSDQAHMTRDFRELAGITPSAYRRLAPQGQNHVPIL